jgi:hypothetical protein
MRTGYIHRAILAGTFMAVMASVSSQAETTTVTNGNNTATITQSGDPAKTQKQIERRPGYTGIQQRNGGNSSVIIQSSPKAQSDPSDPVTTPADPSKPDQLEAEESTPNAPLSDSDVYQRIRKGASPQSQSTLDNLMNALGLQKKM